MAYVPGFQHDIFISYAHVDNEPFFEKEHGWVSLFQRDLEVVLARRLGRRDLVSIWGDSKVRGIDGLDNTIDAARHSAVAIFVLSPAFVTSEWCYRELTQFCSGLDAELDERLEGKSRVLKVLLSHVPYEDMPEPMREILNKTTGYPFYHLDPVSGREEAFRRTREPDQDQRYWSTLNDLAHNLADLLKMMRRPAGDKKERVWLTQKAVLEAAAPVVSREATRIFISYAREDAQAALKLYNDLRAAGLQPWMDKQDLLPGQAWEPIIRSAIKGASHFLALLSRSSIAKRGFYQSEVQHALDVLREIPPDRIFVIPVRLEEVVPHHEALQKLNWVDLFPDYEEGFSRIVRAIRSQSLQGREQRPNVNATSPRPTIPSLTRDVPDEVFSVIHARAERDFPDDFSTRQGRIRREMEAWGELQDRGQWPEIPAEIMALITSRAERDFPDDFSTRRGRIHREVEAWQELQTLTLPLGLPEHDFESIVARATRDFPDDFSTRRARIERELKAWRELYAPKGSVS